MEKDDKIVILQSYIRIWEVLHTIYDQMLAECKRLEDEIREIELRLQDFPQGKLIITRNKNANYKWYVNDGSKLSYMPKRDRQLAEQLAQKRYLTLRVKELNHEKQAIQFYLRHHLNEDDNSRRLLSDPPFQELLFNYFKPIDKGLQEWAKEPYDRSFKYPEQLNYKCISGNVVRSKSESMIDLVLYLNHIPYHYEEALQLGETILYPDFTIRHPNTGKTFYWEHFGMMDNSNYSKNVYSKLQLYNSFQIIPTINLITTFETQESPLNSETVEKIVQLYFL